MTGWHDLQDAVELLQSLGPCLRGEPMPEVTVNDFRRILTGKDHYRRGPAGQMPIGAAP